LQVNAVAAVLERTVNGMGYELVDHEIAGGGLLRVYIDLPAAAYEQPVPEGALPPSVKVEDCEKVSHQLQHVLTVENVDYARLEVSSPGMDRPLKRASDYARFVGEPVVLRLRAPLSGRRNFTGVLVRDEADGRFALELADVKPTGARSAPAGRGSKSGKGAARAGVRPAARAKAPAVADAPVAADAAAQGTETVRRLSFTLDEVERARLVPRYKF